MEELVKKLNAIPDSYFGFVAGIVGYAKMKPERLEKVIEFLNSSDELTSSDVVKFVMSQPDFHEYGLGFKQKDLKANTKDVRKEVYPVNCSEDPIRYYEMEDASVLNGS